RVYGNPALLSIYLLDITLVRFPRAGSGEDWAEKIAAELAEAIGLPHAEYELASVLGKRATLSRRFLQGNANLVLGNELLVDLIPGYGPVRSRYRVSKHTLGVVFAVVGLDRVRVPMGWQPIPFVSNAAEVFVGYLMLDAWISNTDRHHENWGLIGITTSTDEPIAIHLAPTYDHASSLGCHERDERRRRHLGVDPRVTVERYCERAYSALYLNEDDNRPLTTLDAFRKAAQQLHPAAGRAWLDALSGVSDSDAATIVGRIPATRMSPAAVEFAQRMLSINRYRLLSIRSELP
ncbi:MAG: hypothetical protein WD733_08480, partial [Bryobacterales bacterium]